MAHAQHQSSPSMAQSSTSMGGSKARSKNSFCFNVQKQPMSESVVPTWQRSLTCTLGLRVIKVARSHLVEHLLVPMILGRKEAVGDSIPDVPQSTTSSPSSSSAVQVCTPLQFLDQLISIISNRFELITVTIFSLGTILGCNLYSSNLLPHVYIPTFKMPTIGQVWKLFSKGIIIFILI